LSASPKFGYVSVYEADCRKHYRVFVGIVSLLLVVVVGEWLKHDVIGGFVVKSSVEGVIRPEGVEHKLLIKE
jgi:hypothetical protein